MKNWMNFIMVLYVLSIGFSLIGVFSLSSDLILRSDMTGFIVNNRILTLVVISILFMSVLGSLFLMLRFKDSWAKNEEELIDARIEHQEARDRFIRAHNILKERAVSYFGISPEQIKEELDK